MQRTNLYTGIKTRIKKKKECGKESSMRNLVDRSLYAVLRSWRDGLNVSVAVHVLVV